MTPGASDRDAPQLEYGKQSSSRRRWLLAFVLLAAIVGSFAAVQSAREPLRRWQARRAYDRQARAWYAAAATRGGTSRELKYAEAGPGSLGGSPGAATEYRNFALDLTPAFDQNGLPALVSWPVIFTQERTSAVGVKRLLVIVPSGWQGTRFALQTIQVGLLPTGPNAGMIHMLTSDHALADFTGVAAPGELRLYEGAADPVDPAKFFIPFEAGDRRGRIEGTFAAPPASSPDPASAPVGAKANSLVVWSVAPDEAAAPSLTTMPASR